MQLRITAGVLAILAATAFAGAAQAEYFVRPYVQQGAGVVDGLAFDSAKAASVNFGENLQSTVDLGEGTARTYLQISGPDAGGSGFGQAAGVFGDRLTFYGSEDSAVDFSFSFDGTITGPARDPLYDSTMQVGVFASLYVFDAATGATYSNFNSLDSALLSQTAFLDFSNPTEALNEFIQQSLSGSVQVTGISTFDVFASLSTFVSMNDNPGTVTMDFLHTGRFGVRAEPGVTFTSDSGVFLSGPTQAVPEPATWAMLIIGFGGVGAALRSRRRGLAFA